MRRLAGGSALQQNWETSRRCSQDLGIVPRGAIDVHFGCQYTAAIIDKK
jgi:hypothetical protein